MTCRLQRQQCPLAAPPNTPRRPAPTALTPLQGINRATNAFLQWALGDQRYQTWLLGVQEMPKARCRGALAGRECWWAMTLEYRLPRACWWASRAPRSAASARPS